MKLIQQTIRKTFSDRFKRYTFFLCLLLAAVFLITDRIDNGYQPPDDDRIIEEVIGEDGEIASVEEGLAPSTILDIPFLGEIDARDFSLPALAVILGLVDGFNPCAMWVLLYLISLVLSLKDRKRIWLLVGSFVLASGILYFLFMTAWLNAFLFMGYLRPLTLIIGFFALWVGVVDIYESIRDKGKAACELGDSESKSRTMEKIRRVVLAPISFGGLLAIISLAFVVNSIEFLCSAAVPAVYIYILSISPLHTVQYYLYILLYDFFFMLDDLIIFSTAAFAATSSLGEKYAAYAKPVSGVIMLAVGIVMIFFPDLLR
ncbi:MAG: hypothetical protein ABFQ82_05255 [Thermodesulfobacteriota bacterium]